MIGINAALLFTGILSIAKPLDYENTKNYILTVEARDLGEPPLSTQALVNISVIDSNDNTPIFLQSLYTTVVPEDITVGSAVLQVIILYEEYCISIMYCV